MNDQICSFPSKTLYHSKLKGHETVQGHLLGDLPNVESDDDDVNMPVIFFDTVGNSNITSLGLSLSMRRLIANTTREWMEMETRGVNSMKTRLPLLSIGWSVW